MLDLCLNTTTLSSYKIYLYNPIATALKGQLSVQNNKVRKSAHPDMSLAIFSAWRN